MKGVYFIFKRLEGVIAFLFSTGAGKAVRIRNVPLLGHLLILHETLGNIRGKHLIAAVDGCTAVDMAGNLGDDLCGNRGCGTD